MMNRKFFIQMNADEFGIHAQFVYAVVCVSF